MWAFQNFSGFPPEPPPGLCPLPLVGSQQPPDLHLCWAMTFVHGISCLWHYGVSLHISIFLCIFSGKFLNFPGKLRENSGNFISKRCCHPEWFFNVETAYCSLLYTKQNTDRMLKFDWLRASPYACVQTGVWTGWTSVHNNKGKHWLFVVLLVWVYNKALINLEFGPYRKYLLWRHAARTSLRSVCTAWRHNKYFRVWTSLSVNKSIIYHLAVTRVKLLKV